MLASASLEPRADAPSAARLLGALPDDPGLFRQRLADVRRTQGDEGLQQVFVEAGYHGVSGVIDPQLVASPDVPAALREQASRRLAVEELWLAHLQQSLEHATAVLTRAGVTACALKGPLLGTRLYGTHATRHCMDVDLLVPPDAFDRAVQALSAAGYVPEQQGVTMEYLLRYGHHLGFSRAGGPPLELHFRTYAGFGVNLDAGFLIDRATRVQLAPDAQVLVPSPEDEFIYLAAHAAGHSFCRLVWLYDLKLLLRGGAIDMGRVVERAQAAGVATAVAYAADLLRAWLSVEVPASATAALGGVRVGLANRLLAEASRPQRRSARENFEGLVFTSMLCDRPASTLWLLQHHLGRALKRRLKHAVPGLLPDRWAS